MANKKGNPEQPGHTDNDATTLMDVLPTGAEGEHDGKMVSRHASSYLPTPSVRKQPVAPSADYDPFVPQPDAGPTTGRFGVTVDMRWGGEVYAAHFFTPPATVTIGAEGSFPLPQDVMGGKPTAVLLEPEGASFALRTDVPGMTGTLRRNGVAEPLVAGGAKVPVTDDLHAELHFGDFTFHIRRGAVPPSPAKASFARETLVFALSLLLSAVLFGGLVVTATIVSPKRLRAEMAAAAEREREAMLIEVKPTEEIKEEEPKEEEKKPEVPLEAPKPVEQKVAEEKQVERKVDALNELKGEEREEAKRDLVANRMAAETAKVDEALKALEAAQATRMFAVSDDAAGVQAGNGNVVVADPTGELAKELGAGGKIGSVAGTADATTAKVADGLGKDANLGNKKVDIEAHEKKQAVVRVGMAGGESDGELPKDVVKKYIASKKGAIQACYQKGLQANPDLAGKVKVKFLILPTGAVMGADIEDSSLNDDGVESCILNNVKVWHFPPAKGGGTTTVHYPFVFSH